MINGKLELNKIQNNFKNGTKISLKKPQWLRYGDKLNKIFTEVSLLSEEGKICYASLVQANDILFSYFPHNDAPASFVYSFDPYFEENTEDLRIIAIMLFEYKYANPDNVPDEYRKIAEVIADEYDRRSFEFEVNIGGINRKIIFGTTIVFRKHLLKRKLGSPILPILAAPPKTDSFIILPKKFWTKDFKIDYLNAMNRTNC